MTKIIAELCQNHQGNEEILEEMVAKASESGADYAKIQNTNIKNLNYRERFEKGLIEGGKVKVIKRPYKVELERLKKLDLKTSLQKKFLYFCSKYNIKPLTTIFTSDQLNLISRLKFDEIKISSFDCSSHSMIKKIAQKRFKNIFLSTGATYDDEILKSVEILNKYKKKFHLLHCISVYPTPLEFANLNRIKFLKKLNNLVGLSDHSNVEKNKYKIVALALQMKISVIEKHFTILDKKLTKDGIVSANPKQLKEIVNLSKLNKFSLNEYIKKNIKKYEIKKIMGKEIRRLSDLELLNRDYYLGRWVSITHGTKKYNWEN
jgi:sialic acid synthase SpsE